MSDELKIAEGDFIRLHYAGYSSQDYKVVSFRGCLGIFRCDTAKELGRLTALCDLYVRGPESTMQYVRGYGMHYTNMIQGFTKITEAEFSSHEHPKVEF